MWGSFMERWYACADEDDYGIGKHQDDIWIWRRNKVEPIGREQ